MVTIIEYWVTRDAEEPGQLAIWPGDQPPPVTSSRGGWKSGPGATSGYIACGNDRVANIIGKGNVGLVSGDMCRIKLTKTVDRI